MPSTADQVSGAGTSGSLLNDKLSEIEAFTARWKRADGGAIEGAPARREAREAALESIDELVSWVAGRPGIDACVATHDGLPLSASGRAIPDLDGVAAMAQLLHDASLQASRALHSGSPRQLVVVTEHRKLALIVVGDVVIAIQAPVETDLGVALVSPRCAEEPSP